MGTLRFAGCTLLEVQESLGDRWGRAMSYAFSCVSTRSRPTRRSLFLLCFFQLTDMRGRTKVRWE